LVPVIDIKSFIQMILLRPEESMISSFQERLTTQS